MEYPRGDCEACPARIAGVKCAAEPRADRAAAYHLCALVAKDPDRHAPAVRRMSRELAGLPVPPEPPPPPSPLRSAREIPANAFVDESDLARDTLSLLPHLQGVDAVVAIARSGLLPGSILAMNLHVPLLAVNQHDGRISDPGRGVRLDGDAPLRRIAIVDDTAARGRAMSAAVPAVRARYPEAEIVRVVVYCHPQATEAVDLYAGLYGGTHYLSWNFVNAGHGQAMATDFDGILCRDFTPDECASMDAYRVAMQSIEPRYLPRRRSVSLIVTARPESCRDLTEAWLRAWGVRWDRLVMWPGQPHPPGGEVAPWKAEIYRQSDHPLFVESDPVQAETIARLAGKPVLCPAAKRRFDPPAPTPPVSDRPLPPLAAVWECPYRVPRDPMEESQCGCSEKRRAYCLLGKARHSDGLVSLSECAACRGAEA